MSEAMTLPELQYRLDHLQPGGAVYISRQQYADLFGENDAASGRLKNFALAHNWTTNWDRAGLRFVRALRA